MREYRFSRLSDASLTRFLVAIVTRDRRTTAALIACLAEVDARKLYLPAGYSSMHAFCIEELRMSEDAAHRRIRAARVSREHPEVLAALADGRLHLTAVVVLAPHLKGEGAGELLKAAEHKNRLEIERLVACRFPRPDVAARVEAIASATATLPQGLTGDSPAPARVDGPPPRVAPIAPQRFALQATITEDTLKKLRYAQELLSHRVRPGDLAEVLDRALDALIEKLEKRKFAATSKPRTSSGGSADGRHVPAEIKRAVWRRDEGRCTFVGESGRRCDSRTLLEFDHEKEYSRGGEASVSNLRLRCRAHNQYGAEQAFGKGFMEEKRGESRERKSEGAMDRESASGVKASARGNAVTDPARDVTPWLRHLGFRAEEARRAATHCESLGDLSLENRRARRAGISDAGSSATGGLAIGGVTCESRRALGSVRSRAYACVRR